MTAHVLKSEILIGDITENAAGAVFFSLDSSVCGNVAVQRFYKNHLTNYPLPVSPYGPAATNLRGGVAVDAQDNVYEPLSYLNFSEDTYFGGAAVFPQNHRRGTFVPSSIPDIGGGGPVGSQGGAIDGQGRYWAFATGIGALIISDPTSPSPSVMFVPIPTSGDDFLLAITRGPGSNMWVGATSLFGGDFIYEVSDQGVVRTFTLAIGTLPLALATDPKGNVWYTDFGHNKIGRLRPDGSYNEYAIPSPNAKPVGIALGSDGAMWFTENATNRIGRITTHGRITEYDVPIKGNPDGITGPSCYSAACNQSLWFVQVSPYGSPAIVEILKRHKA